MRWRNLTALAWHHRLSPAAQLPFRLRANPALASKQREGHRPGRNEAEGIKAEAVVETRTNKATGIGLTPYPFCTSCVMYNAPAWSTHQALRRAVV